MLSNIESISNPLPTTSSSEEQICWNYDGDMYCMFTEELVITADAEPQVDDGDQGWPEEEEDDDPFGWGDEGGEDDGQLGCPTNESCGGGFGDDNSEGENAFAGGIGIDEERLNELPKLKCVVGKILDTSNMQDLIYEFGMSYTNYDLIFSGKENLEDDESGDPILGELVHEERSPRDAFIVYANANEASSRNSVEVVITYLHETMHAEMRRYLLDNADTSTLPNFPGSITEDWENYVATKKNLEAAEHHAMGYTEYIDFIAQAASDFDNGSMPFTYYQGLAWVGIYDKDNEGWINTIEAYKSKIRKGHSNAKEELKDRDNDICN